MNSTGSRPIAKAIWPLQFRIKNNQSILSWCDHIDIDVGYLIQCVNDALEFWNEQIPGDNLVFSPDFIFNWGSQPDLEWQIPSWISLKKTSSIWAGQGTQNMSKYSNECVKGFIDIEGYNGPAVYTKLNGIDKYEIPKEDVLNWICKHELGHILGFWHIQGEENQNNIMHSGNREIPLAIETGERDLEMLKIQYPAEFGLTPTYKKIWNNLYWKIN